MLSPRGKLAYRRRLVKVKKKKRCYMYVHFLFCRNWTVSHIQFDIVTPFTYELLNYLNISLVYFCGKLPLSCFIFRLAFLTSNIFTYILTYFTFMVDYTLNITINFLHTLCLRNLNTQFVLFSYDIRINKQQQQKLKSHVIISRTHLGSSKQSFYSFLFLPYTIHAYTHAQYTKRYQLYCNYCTICF